MSTTIKDVAKRASVSPSTVSLVINDRSDALGISHKTKDRVLSAMKELNYVPSLYARHIRKKSTFTIGMIVTDISHPVTAGIVEGIKQEIVDWKENYEVIFGVSSTKAAEERNYLNNFLSRRVSGLIVIPVASGETIKDIEELFGQGFPIIICKQPFYAKADSVIHDVRAGEYFATKHLIEVGCKKIAAVYDSFQGLKEPSSYAKYSGYRQALDETGLEFKNEYLLQVNILSEDVGEYTADMILALVDKPDGIVFINDEVASRTMISLLKRGVRIPQDLSIVGFDGLMPADSFQIPLTTVKTPIAELGKETAKLLYKRIKELELMGKDYAPKPKHIRLVPDLIIRESTSPA